MNVLFISGDTGDTRRYRCHHHQEQLALHGHTSVLREHDDLQLYVDATTCDFLILHRVPYSRLIGDCLQIVRQRNKPVAFETDDLIFEPTLFDRISYADSLDEATKRSFLQKLQAQAETFQRCDNVITTTQFLADAAKKHGKRAYVVRNACSQRMMECAEVAYQLRLQRQTQANETSGERPIILGYFSGTKSHNRDFAQITPVLLEIFQTFPQVHLHIGGYLDLDARFDGFANRIKHLPFVDWQQLPHSIAEIDINLAPLELDNPFCQSKSELKYIEAALVGVPTIASATDAFTFAIVEGQTGLVAASEEKWRQGLRRLIQEPAYRKVMGEEARQQVCADYSAGARSQDLLAILSQIEQAIPSVEAAPDQVMATVVKAMQRQIDEMVQIQAQQAQQIRNLQSYRQSAPRRSVRPWQRTISNRIHSAAILSDMPIGTSMLYRSVHLKEQFALNQIDATVHWWQDHDLGLIEQALKADLIVLQRVDMNSSVHHLTVHARARNKRVIFDADDLIFEPELALWNRTITHLGPEQQHNYIEGVKTYLATLLESDYALLSSTLLTKLVQKRGRTAFLHRNCVGHEMQKLGDEFLAERQKRPSGNTIVIGYGSGTATHNVDFEQVTQPLAEILQRHAHVQLWIVGPLELTGGLERYADRVRRFSLTDLRGWFQLASQFDITLAPLELGNPFCEAKSEIKFVEAGLVGVPTVASRIMPFEETIQHGQNGFLAGSTVEWVDALEQLVMQPELRQRIGLAARKTVDEHYRLQVRAAELATILDVIQQDRRRSWKRTSHELRRLYQQTLNVAKSGGVNRLFNEARSYVKWRLMRFR